MKRLVFVTLIIFLNILFSYNAYAFTFVEEGFPKEPDHNKKWILFEVGTRKYYVETEKEIDIYNVVNNGYIYIHSDVYNNGKSFTLYRNYSGAWRSQVLSRISIELGGNRYKILYTNYDIKNKFYMIEPYLRYYLNCVNLVEILKIGIIIISLMDIVIIIKRIIWGFLS